MNYTIVEPTTRTGAATTVMRRKVSPPNTRASVSVLLPLARPVEPLVPTGPKARGEAAPDRPPPRPGPTVITPGQLDQQSEDAKARPRQRYEDLSPSKVPAEGALAGPVGVGRGAAVRGLS